MDESKEKDFLVQQIREQRVEAILAAIAARIGKTRLMVVIIDRELIVTEISETNPFFIVLQEMEAVGESVRWVDNTRAQSGRMAVFTSLDTAHRVARRIRIA